MRISAHACGAARVLARVLSLAVFLAPSPRALGAEIPPFTRPVTDLAHLLSPDTTERLERELRAFRAETSHQIAVLTLPTLGGVSIEAVSIQVAQRWGLGQKGRDNGILLIIAHAERKVRIEVGYGLEGILPDVRAKRIVADAMAPRLKVDDYAGGIAAGLRAVMAVVAQERLVPPATAARALTPSQVELEAADAQLAAARTKEEITAALARFNAADTRLRSEGPPSMDNVMRFVVPLMFLASIILSMRRRKGLNGEPAGWSWPQSSSSSDSSSGGGGSSSSSSSSDSGGGGSFGGGGASGDF